MLQALAALAARSRLVTRLRFGVVLPPLQAGEHGFDSTTLALQRACALRIAPGARVLEIGAGSFAVLSLWLQRSHGCRVTCTEIDPAIAERARACIARHGAGVPVVTGAYFAGCEGPFDFVVCNPPYVPTRSGERRRLPANLRSQWDGGTDGSAVLDGFLGAFGREGGAALALVGVNARHVPRARVEALLAAHPGLALRAVEVTPWLPALVYVVAREGALAGSTP